jgi:hypothetical protein
VGLVLIATFAQVAAVYREFLLHHHRDRFSTFFHDRNAHLHYGMAMAAALRQGDAWELVSQFEKGKTWPPVHGLVSAAVFSVLGLDHRWGVIPSLAGWALTMIVAFLLARRLVVGPVAGSIAGATAWLLVAGSPAHRGYAADSMLESLGAGLSLLALYLYARAKERPNDLGRWSLLAAGLTALFFEKYNYWFLVAIPLLLVEGVLRTRSLIASGQWPKVTRAILTHLAREARQPLNILGITFFVIALVVLRRGPTSINLSGAEIQLHPPGTLLTVGFAAIYARWSIVCLSRGWHRPATIGVPAAALLWGHLLPIALSFCIPRRLLYFLGFLSPTNAGDAPIRDTLHALHYYVGAWVADYHPLSVVAMAVALSTTLFLVALPRHRSMGFVVATAILLSLLLTMLHPNQKSRFLHSWIPIVWVAASVGAMSLARSASRGILRMARSAPAIALTLVAACGWLESARQPLPTALVDSVPGRSMIDIADLYLDRLGPDRPSAILATLPDHLFFRWTYIERFGSLAGFEQDNWLWYTPTSSADLESRLHDWLSRTEAQTLVLIDVPPESPFYVDNGCHPYDIYGQLDDVLGRQRLYRPTGSSTVHLGVRVTIWTRAVDLVQQDDAPPD